MGIGGPPPAGAAWTLLAGAPSPLASAGCWLVSVRRTRLRSDFAGLEADRFIAREALVGFFFMAGDLFRRKEAFFFVAVRARFLAVFFFVAMNQSPIARGARERKTME